MLAALAAETPAVIVVWLVKFDNSDSRLHIYEILTVIQTHQTHFGDWTGMLLEAAVLFKNDNVFSNVEGISVLKDCNFIEF